MQRAFQGADFKTCADGWYKERPSRPDMECQVGSTLSGYPYSFLTPQGRGPKKMLTSLRSACVGVVCAIDTRLWLCGPDEQRNFHTT